jgi:hypothetical protein
MDMHIAKKSNTANPPARVSLKPASGNLIETLHDAIRDASGGSGSAHGNRRTVAAEKFASKALPANSK